MKLSRNFCVPMAEYQMPQPERLCTELSELFLEYEKDPQRYRNKTTRTTQHGLFESTFDLFHWRERPVQELAQFCHINTFRLVAEVCTHTEQELQQLRFDYHAWFHVTRKYGFQGAHSHQNASLSGIFCVDPGDPVSEHPRSGVVRFHDPRTAAFTYLDQGNLEMKQPFAHGVVELYHEQGKLLVFPSYLIHEIFPYYGERPRIVVAYNCWISKVTPKKPQAGLASQ